MASIGVGGRLGKRVGGESQGLGLAVRLGEQADGGTSLEEIWVGDGGFGQGGCVLFKGGRPTGVEYIGLDGA